MMKIMRDLSPKSEEKHYTSLINKNLKELATGGTCNEEFANELVKDILND